MFVGCADRCDDGGIRTMTADLRGMRVCILLAVALFLFGVGALVAGSHTGLNAFGWAAGIAWGIAVVAAFVGLAIGLGRRP